MKFKDYIDPTYSAEVIEEAVNDTDKGLGKKPMHLVVLGYGDEEGTFSSVVSEVAKKRKLKYDLIKVEEAYIADTDLEVGEVTFHNYDGEDKKIRWMITITTKQ